MQITKRILPAFGLTTLLAAVAAAGLFCAWFREHYAIVPRPKWDVVPPADQPFLAMYPNWNGFRPERWYTVDWYVTQSGSDCGELLLRNIHKTEPERLFCPIDPPMPNQAEREAMQRRWLRLKARVRTATANDPGLVTRSIEGRLTAADLRALGL